MNELWDRVDRYLGDLLVPQWDDFPAILEANRAANLPAIDVPPFLGKLLEILIGVSGARRVLEIGTLGGYSTAWLARALPGDGRVLTLELDPRHAEIARANLRLAGLLDRVDLRVGPAVDTLRSLYESGSEPFDLLFLDADKQGLPEYLHWSMKLARPGSLIVADNVVRDGKVIDPNTPDAQIQGVRRFLELVGAEPRLRATALQTVGSRGYDGFAVALVTG